MKYTFPPKFYQGRMIAMSKTNYSKRHPNQIIMYNACLCTKSDGIIWNGDVNANEDKTLLNEVRKIIGEDLYFLREYDGIDYQNLEPVKLIKKAVFVVREDHIEVIDEYWKIKFGII